MGFAPSHPAEASVCVIVPVYNESEVLNSVLAELLALYPNVVVVDDGSTDNSSDIARAAGATVLRHAYNLGQGAALQTGIAYALLSDVDYIVTFDGDGQHQVSDIAHLLQPLENKQTEVVLGSRFLGSPQNIPLTRRLLLRGGVIFSRIVSRIPITDTHNGLRAFTRDAAKQIHISMNRMAHASQILDQIGRANLRFTEVPVTIRYTDYSRAKGQSNANGALILAEYLVGRLIR